MALFPMDFKEYHPKMNVEHPLATSIVESCFKCEQRMPGYAYSFIQRLCSFSGRKGCEPHYDQLLQHLAELIVIAHLAEKIDESWIFPPYKLFFRYKKPLSTS